MSMESLVNKLCMFRIPLHRDADAIEKECRSKCILLILIL